MSIPSYYAGWSTSLRFTKTRRALPHVARLGS